MTVTKARIAKLEKEAKKLLERKQALKKAKNFSVMLKDLRGDRSLREVEKATGISHTYISTLEKGVDPRTRGVREPSCKTLRKLAGFYGISYIQLLIKIGYVTELEINEYKKNKRPVQSHGSIKKNIYVVIIPRKGIL